jgi:hypothetical protein
VSKYTSRLEEHLIENERDKEEKFVLFLMIFFSAVAITVLMNFDLARDNDSGFFMALLSVIGVSFEVVAVPPLIHIVISSMWETKRNNRTRKNIILGWSIYSIVSNLLFLR